MMTQRCGGQCDGQSSRGQIYVQSKHVEVFEHGLCRVCADCVMWVIVLS